MNRLFIVACTLFFLVSCQNEEDASDVVIQLQNWTSNQKVAPGDVIRINVKSFTINESIRKFEIVSFDSENGSQILYETAPESKEFKYEYAYTVPSFRSDSIHVELKFKVTDNIGNVQETITNIIVKGGRLLSEKSGVRLYAGNSGREDGFSLADPSQIFATSLVDVSKIDVYAYDDANQAGSLSREWRTKTDVEFVKVNTFDYSQASTASLGNAYLSSKRSPNVKNIQNGDIILIGKGQKVWGVILVVFAYDVEGTYEDGYLFNYKSIN